MRVLSNTSSVSSVESKLVELSKMDAHYVRFFKNVGGNLANGTMNFENFKEEDWRLFINMVQTFTKQNPEALIQYVDGKEVYTAPANQFTIAKNTQDGWMENTLALSQDKDAIVKWDKKKIGRAHV